MLHCIDKMAFGINCKIIFIAKVRVVSYAFKLETTIGIAHAFWHNDKSRSTV